MTSDTSPWVRCASISIVRRMMYDTPCPDTIGHRPPPLSNGKVAARLLVTPISPRGVVVGRWATARFERLMPLYKCVLSVERFPGSSSSKVGCKSMQNTPQNVHLFSIFSETGESLSKPMNVLSSNYAIVHRMTPKWAISTGFISCSPSIHSIKVGFI